MANEPFKSTLGHVSAYLDAKAHGFTGTREEFGELLANAGTYFQRAEEAAEQAEGYARTASDAAEQTGEDAQTASRAADTATDAADSASRDAQTANDAADTASDAADTATQKAGDAEIAAENAGQYASNADQSAQEAKGYLDTVKASATAAAQSASAASASETNAAASEQHAQELVDTLPDDYADMLKDVSGLNETKDIRTVSGDLVSFDSSYADMPLKKVTVDVEPVQAGSGDPSPDNVRPITGWTGAKVTRTGKNIYEPNDWAMYANGTPFLYWGYPVTQITNVIQALPVGQYFASMDFEIMEVGSGTNIEYGFQLTGSGVGGGRSRTRYSTRTVGQIIHASASFTRNSNPTSTLMFYLYSASDRVKLKNFQIERGSVESSYEPYQGETYDITFPSEAGTVYGGKLEINEDGSGVLTVDKAKRVLDGTESYADYWSLSTTNRIGVYIIGTYQNEYTDFCCSDYTVLAYSTMHDMGICKANSNNSAYIIQDSIHATSVAEYKQYVTTRYNNSNPIEIAYKLATPQTYQLTAQQITTLLGANNLWADTGDVEVQYGAFISTIKNELGEKVPKLMIAPIEKTTTASKAYVVNEFLIMGDKLYIVTANIASGGTITIGTNVSETTIGAQITALLNA